LSSWIKTTACFLIGFLLLGCHYQRSIDLPEEIYAAPDSNRYYHAKVGLFKFSEPSYASDVGTKATNILYKELLKNKVFSNVNLEDSKAGYNRHSRINIAQAKNYDLIITGEVLYYLEGSDFQETRIVQEIRVLRVKGNKAELLWWAKAKENVPPANAKDLIFFRAKGAAAPPIEDLMQRNAKKFAEMLLNQPPGE